MKSLLTFLLLLSFGSLLPAQAATGINYQAVARDGDGELLADRSIQVVFAVRPSGGNVAYSESHNLTTNAYGLFSAVIGAGTATIGSFSDLNWNGIAYELGVSIDGNNLGFTPLQSVPYALASAPRRGIASVPAAVFTPNNNLSSFISSVGNGGAEIRVANTSVPPPVLNAPISLPHGARLTKMTVYYKDDSEEEMRIWLATENFGPGFAIVSEVITVGADADWRSESVDLNHVVSNDGRGYFIRVYVDDWDVPGSKVIKGIQIEYTY